MAVPLMLVTIPVNTLKLTTTHVHLKLMKKMPVPMMLVKTMPVNKLKLTTTQVQLKLVKKKPVP